MQLQNSKILPFTQEQVFSVVHDVTSYQEFLPWCARSRILWQNPPEFEGELEISFGPFRHAFSTINKVQFPSLISMKLAKGPFRMLEGYWSFKEITKQSCEVSFKLIFEFYHSILSYAFSVFFQQIYSSLIDSFEARLYSLFPANVGGNESKTL